MVRFWEKPEDGKIRAKHIKLQKAIRITCFIRLEKEMAEDIKQNAIFNSSLNWHWMVKDGQTPSLQIRKHHCEVRLSGRIKIPIQNTTFFDLGHHSQHF